MNAPLRRWLMALGLVAQIVLYYAAAARLASAAAASGIGGTTSTNTFVFDATGVIFWCFVLLFLEGDFIPRTRKWLRYSAIVVCLLITLVVVSVNLYALRGV